MQTRNAGRSLPNPHSFYIPVRVMALDQASFNGDNPTQPFTSFLVVITRGSEVIELDGERIRLSGGHILYSDSSVDITLPRSHKLQGVWIEYAAISGNIRTFSPLNHRQPVRSCPSHVSTLAVQLLSDWNQPEQRKPFALQALFTELLSELYDSSAEYAEPPSQWIDRILQYIESHYNEDLTREQAAGLAGITPEHFSRSFRKFTGQTFNQYITLLRIRKAQQRILTGAPNLSTLALEVGYSEGTYLSRKFKQVVGISPSSYHRKSKSVVSLNFNHTASLHALEVVPRLGVYSAWMESLQPVPSRKKLLDEGISSSGLYERLSSARPDVIISYSLPDKSKQLLSVAPVIEIPFMQMDWREQFRLIAEVTGRQPQAEAWLSLYDWHCHQANQMLDRRIGDRGTAIVLELGTEAAYCFSSSYGRGAQILYHDLGFRPPLGLVAEGLLEKGYLEIAFQNIARYPADHIFITSSREAAEALEPLQSLLHPVHQHHTDDSPGGRIYFLNQPCMFYGFDPLSSEAQLKVLVQALTS
ncbi:Fe3+-hydroxamate ABC transporter periplasmic protein [Paenibacillus sp. FSL R7-269]|uniref:helix-turn-helix domain-containing protein n=1 Tax=Paenibacillus sp. FSL R7-269 TaxID=1226755 RepID=UPI0003E1F21A|nr:helix-turn-helix domain-containing protein [Paenibacillus sp. FSL R7-269]ETT44174.1 Fe3+-hydroxamate ABC transporter periplasmic protein [Paenibacillus sp. FSL R7-269]